MGGRRSRLGWSGSRQHIHLSESHYFRLTIDLLEKKRNVVIVEWKATTKHNVENHAAAPDVDFWARVESR